MVQSARISVIIAVYNTSFYLRKCLDSVCGQTYTNLEIICVDDGSTDDSAKILAEYAARDTRIHIIHQHNQGLSAARNAGLDQASGEFVTGIDSDDWIEPDTYEAALRLMDRDIDMVVFGTRICGHISEREREVLTTHHRLHYKGSQEVTPQLIMDTNVSWWNKIWRRDFIKSHGLRFHRGLLYEDGGFFFEATPYMHKIAYLPEEKYNYFQREGSIMNQDKRNSMRGMDFLKIADKVLEYYRDKGLPKGMERMEEAVFSYSWICSLVHLPPQAWRQAADLGNELVRKYNLHHKFPDSCPIWEAYIPSLPWYLNPFVAKKRNKVVFRFCYIPVFSCKYRCNGAVYRLLGIPVLRKKIYHLPQFS